MKCIGLFLSSEPSAGGVQQYSLSIIKALESYDRTQFKIRCFYFNSDWEVAIPAHFLKTPLNRIFFDRAISVLVRGLSRSYHVWKWFGAHSKTAKIINNSDCDVVIYPAQDALAYQVHKKSIATIHDLMHRYESHFQEYQGKECEIRDEHYKGICQYANLILVDSQIGKEHVAESYGRDHKVSILPFVPPAYLLESSKIEFAKTHSLPTRYIFYPAQFWEHKNHLILLQAIKILRDRNMIVNLFLVGSKKNYYENVLSKIKEYGLEAQVYILGYVSNEEMYSLYKQAIAMVFPSLIGPTNIPPMEALLTGCPLICSNAYAMPEQVGNAALLFNPKSPEELADKIEMVWTDEVTRESLIKLGQIKIAQYSQVQFNQTLLNCINEVID